MDEVTERGRIGPRSSTAPGICLPKAPWQRSLCFWRDSRRGVAAVGCALAGAGDRGGDKTQELSKTCEASCRLELLPLAWIYPIWMTCENKPLLRLFPSLKGARSPVQPGEKAYAVLSFSQKILIELSVSGPTMHLSVIPQCHDSEGILVRPEGKAVSASLLC